MKDRILVGLVLAMTTAPAFAGIPAPLPEPTTMSLFGIGIAGAFVARKLIGRK